MLEAILKREGIYDEITSRKIYNDIKEKYVKEFEKLKEKLEVTCP